MLGTRGVLAILAGIAMTFGVVALRTGRKPLGLWLLTAGFGTASLWSGLSIFWARNNASMLSAESHLMLGTMAGAGTIYYGVLAREAVSERE
ncbi:hypothetical protein [Halomicrococcus sp. NG-SE-24]|uniref:hypothetical protein n=1 Tax=Halomicrococcus sp. NG-SE-24 TaxID=3436928 RepID=UPI000DE074F2|nr:hypothetical protein DMJ13_15740 [halophilic archaeon]